VKPTSIVLDATVAVDALLRPDAPAGRLVRRFLERRDFEVLLTEGLLEEMLLASTDPRVLDQLGLSREEVERWIVALGVLATLVDAGGGGAVAADATLAAAAAAGECVIVSLDPELLSLPATGDLEVVRPEVLMEILEARDGAGPSAGRTV
jgi:predicted nucleic acid-binding protein